MLIKISCFENVSFWGFFGGRRRFGLAWYFGWCLHWQATKVRAWIMKRKVPRFGEDISPNIQSSRISTRLREGEGQCYSYISSSPSAGFPSVSVCALYCCTVVKWGKHFITIVIYITQQMITGMSNILLKLSGFWLIKIFTVYFY